MLFSNLSFETSPGMYIFSVVSFLTELFISFSNTFNLFLNSSMFPNISGENAINVKPKSYSSSTCKPIFAPVNAPAKISIA